MRRRGMTRLTETHERMHDATEGASANEVFVADVNPLMRQLLLACEAINKETPEWQHA